MDKFKPCLLNQFLIHSLSPSQDDLAELTESFFVNITSVRLVNEADRQGSVSNSPRIGQPAVEVQILENDDSRGSLSFVDQTITVQEVINGRARLEVRRSGGTFGTVGAEFTAVGVSASSLDFEPSEGTVMFESGAEVAFIEITIVNDLEPEMEEVIRPYYAIVCLSLMGIKFSELASKCI